MASPAHVLARPGSDAVRDHSAPKSSASAASSSTVGTVGSQDRQAGRVREWLLLLLRFAITWDPMDEAAVLAIADEIDALGLSWRPSAPSFFRRTSREVCKAITALDDPQRATILKNHIARIDNSRLRRAFRAAVDLREKSSRTSL
jgi:hypothetical protein